MKEIRIHLRYLILLVCTCMLYACSKKELPVEEDDSVKIKKNKDVVKATLLNKRQATFMNKGRYDKYLYFPCMRSSEDSIPINKLD